MRLGMASGTKGPFLQSGLKHKDFVVLRLHETPKNDDGKEKASVLLEIIDRQNPDSRTPEADDLRSFVESIALSSPDKDIDTWADAMRIMLQLPVTEEPSTSAKKT